MDEQEEPLQHSTSSISKPHRHFDEVPPVPLSESEVPYHEEPVHQDEDEQPAAGTSLVVQSFRAVFGFRKSSLTLFVVLTLLAVFLSVPLAREYSLLVPSPEPRELSTAWLDLQVISSKPHPYVSHANDDVHDYILQRVHSMAKRSLLNVSVDDDMASGLTYMNVLSSWKDNADNYYPLQYFKSSNVLVKIEGSDPSLDGLLLSAHYDSVGTSFGTTDDGAGVASLMGVLEYYTQGKQPLRTIVFNFNNNEEFGLYGAIAFFNHKWSKLVKYVINLEGTGTGERAILFRASDYGVAQKYSAVRSPFATSIYQQAFASGLIASETDYRVYTGMGMRGFDIAFYKPRDMYHTANDNIRHTSKNALWHMLGNTLDLTHAIANAENIVDDASPPVFFDVLGLQFFIVSLDSLKVLNIVLLVIIPFILIVLGLIVHKRQVWSLGYSWIRLPISSSVAFFITKALNDSIYHLNVFIVSRDFITPLLALSSTFLFVNYAILSITESFWPMHDLKLVITLEVFAALWAALVYTTFIGENNTGMYILTVLYTLYGTACTLGLFGLSVSSSPKRIELSDEPLDEQTPLLDSHCDDNMGKPHAHGFTYDWSLQYLIIVPLSTLISYISLELCLEGLNQTIQESHHSGVLIYSFLLLGSVLLTVPLLGFAYKLNYLFALLLISTVVITSLQSVFMAPFTESAPMKFRMAQLIEGERPVMEVSGREGFIKQMVGDLPSVKQHNTSISCSSLGDGSEICHYDSMRPYLLNGTLRDNAMSHYLDISVTKHDEDPSPFSPMKSSLSINVEQNRFCSISFNTSSYKSASDKSPVRAITFKSGKNETETFKWVKGIDLVSLHKLDWDSNYELDIQWIPKWLEDGEEQPPADSPLNRLGVSVVCHWGEYYDDIIVDGEIGRMIPAFDELVQYSPAWTSFSNRYEGLVKIGKYVEL